MSQPLFPPLPAELVAFVEGGHSVLLGTCDEALEPEAVQGIGVRVHPSASILTVYIPRATSKRTVANLRLNGRLAVTLSEPFTHRTVQIEGRVFELRDADDGERPLIEEFHRRAADERMPCSMQPGLTSRPECWPAVAAEVEVLSCEPIASVIDT